MSLTEAGEMVKKLIPVVILVIIVLLILFFGIRLLILLVQNQNAPDSSLTPTPHLLPVFKNIERPQLSEALPSSRYDNYFLDTLDGTAVSATSSGNVYFLPKSSSNLTYRSRAFSMAKAIGFNTETAKYEDNRDEENVVFSDGKRNLQIDTRDFNFSYEYKLTNSDPMLATRGLPSEGSITAKAVGFLESINKYPKELSQGTPTVLYINYDTQQRQLSIVDNPEEANMVEVDFRRPDQPLGGDKVPVVSPNYFNTQNYVVMVFGGEDNTEHKVVRAEIVFYPKSDEQVGIYPLKSGDQAWTDLQEGKGYIVSFPPDDTERVNIKNMFVGYLNPEGYQPYLQPVYVFLGENNYIAYVPAIIDSFLTDPEEATESGALQDSNESTPEADITDESDEPGEETASPEAQQSETLPEEDIDSDEDSQAPPDTEDLPEEETENEFNDDTSRDLEESPTEEVLQEDTPVR